MIKHLSRTLLITWLIVAAVNAPSPAAAQTATPTLPPPVANSWYTADGLGCWYGGMQPFHSDLYGLNAWYVNLPLTWPTVVHDGVVGANFDLSTYLGGWRWDVYNRGGGDAIYNYSVYDGSAYPLVGHAGQDFVSASAHFITADTGTGVVKICPKTTPTPTPAQSTTPTINPTVAGALAGGLAAGCTLENVTPVTFSAGPSAALIWSVSEFVYADGVFAGLYPLGAPILVGAFGSVVLSPPGAQYVRCPSLDPVLTPQATLSPVSTCREWVALTGSYTWVTLVLGEQLFVKLGSGRAWNGSVWVPVPPYSQFPAGYSYVPGRQFMIASDTGEDGYTVWIACRGTGLGPTATATTTATVGPSVTRTATPTSATPSATVGPSPTYPAGCVGLTETDPNYADCRQVDLQLTQVALLATIAAPNTPYPTQEPNPNPTRLAPTSAAAGIGLPAISPIAAVVWTAGPTADLVLIIPTWQPLQPLITATISITSTAIGASLRAIATAVSGPASTITAWSAVQFGPDPLAAAAVDAAPVAAYVSSALGWLAIFNLLGPFSWLLPPVFIALLIRIIRAILSLVKYIKQIIPVVG